MIGLYSFGNGTDSRETPDIVASFFSSASATVTTTLPNYVIPNPTYSTPPYTFNSSIPAPVGGIVVSGLATSTYSPIIGQSVFNVTALPTISPSPLLTTLTMTNSYGQLTTSVSTHALPAATLGIPVGWSGSSTFRVPGFLAMVVPCVIFLWTTFSW